MTARRILRQLRRALTGTAPALRGGAVFATQVALPLLLATAVVADSAQASRAYVYCAAMQGVMAHPCCTHAAPSCVNDAPVVAPSAPECCQVRSLPASATWTQSSRAIGPSAQRAAIVLGGVHELLRDPSAALSASADPSMRTGPPRLRALSLLQVFRI
jgi:hypothetical protein